MSASMWHDAAELPDDDREAFAALTTTLPACVHCASDERPLHTNDDGNRECIDRVACLWDVMEATL